VGILDQGDGLGGVIAARKKMASVWGEGAARGEGAEVDGQR
jgi:hypothetical protein